MSSGGPERKKARIRFFAETGLGIVACLLILSLFFLGREKTQAQSLPQFPGPTPSSLRIATWNVRDCSATEPSSKSQILLHDDIARFIADSQADIVVFEEVQVDTAKGGDIALLSAALAKAGRPMPFVAVVDTRGEDDIAIFSRFAIQRYEPVLVPAKADPWPRSGLHATISVAGAALHVYGFHFKAMGDGESEMTRKQQAKALQTLLVSSFDVDLDTANLVLAGDFNTANPSDFEGKASTLSILSFKDDDNPKNDFISSNYSYKQNLPTFIDSRYSSLLDHIFLSPSLGKGLEAKDVNVIPPFRRNDGIPVSDHAMVVVSLALPLK